MRLPILFAATSIALAPAMAQAADRTGEVTLGLIMGVPDVVGGEISYRADDSYGLRAGMSGIKMSGIKITDEFEGSINTLAGMAFADWYPTQAGFRLSAGLHAGAMKVSVKDNISSDGTVLNGYVKNNDLRPTVSLGYVTSGTLQFSADAGVTYLGNPKISANLLDEVEFKAEVKGYDVIPFARIGLAYRF
jgi:hypothetical protein